MNSIYNSLKTKNKILIYNRDNYLYYAAALIGILAFIFFSYYAFIIVFLLIFQIMFEIWGQKIVLFISSAALLTLTSTINENLRLVVQVAIPILLAFNFLKKYGLEFQKYPRIPKPIFHLIAFLYSALIISTIFSDYIFLGMQQIFRQTAFFIIVYFIYSLIEDKTDIKILLGALFLTGIIYGLNLFIYFFTNGKDLIQSNIEQINKLQTGYLNTNGIASFFLILFSIILSFLFKRNSKYLKASLAIGMLVTVLTFVIANSRAAFLSALISAIFIFTLLNKKLLYRLVAVVIITTLCVFLIDPLYKLIEIYLRVESIATGRDFIFESVWNVIKTNFWLGSGPAGTKHLMYANLPFMLGSPEELFIYIHWNIIDFGHAHNFYLFFLSDMGILGFIVSLFLPVVFIKMGIRSSRFYKDRDRFYYFLVIGITGAGISLFIRGIFEWSNLISYGTLANDLPFWTIFVMLGFLNKLESVQN